MNNAPFNPEQKNNQIPIPLGVQPPTTTPAPVANQLPDATQVFSVINDENSTPSMGLEQNAFPYLQVVKGPYAGETFTLNNDLITIGRDPSCSVFLNDMTVSREHCKLTKHIDGWHLLDCGSLNGTWVNGAIVSEAPLTDGASIQIGTYMLVLHLNLNSSTQEGMTEGMSQIPPQV